MEKSVNMTNRAAIADAARETIARETAARRADARAAAAIDRPAADAIAAAMAAAESAYSGRGGRAAAKIRAARRAALPAAIARARAAAADAGADKISASRAAWSAWRAYIARHEKRVNHYIIVTRRGSCATMTDTAAAAIDRAAVIMAYTAVKTAYSNSGNDYLRRLMTAATDEFRRLNYTAAAADAAARAGGMVTVRRARVNGIWRELRRPVMRLTARDTARINACRIADSTDFSDCVSAAMAELLEIVNAGGVTCFSDIWNFAPLVYSAVNSYIHSQRAARARAADIDRAAAVADARADAAIDAIDRAAAADAICDYLRGALPSKSNKWRIVSAARRAAHGYSNRETAAIMGVSDRCVGKYIQIARRHMSTVDGLTYLHTHIFS